MDRMNRTIKKVFLKQCNNNLMFLKFENHVLKFSFAGQPERAHSEHRTTICCRKVEEIVINCKDERNRSYPRRTMR